jgi:hypothetical protein
MREPKKLRGIFEKIPGSGVWWVEHYDADAKRHRELAGTKATTIKLQAKRQADKLARRPRQGATSCWFAWLRGPATRHMCVLNRSQSTSSFRSPTLHALLRTGQHHLLNRELKSRPCRRSREETAGHRIHHRRETFSRSGIFWPQGRLILLRRGSRCFLSCGFLVQLGPFGF